jgi:hypothetical protein
MLPTGTSSVASRISAASSGELLSCQDHRDADRRQQADEGKFDALLLVVISESAKHREQALSQSGGKQVDPVNFSWLVDTADPLQPMRRRIFDYVARLVKFRTQQPALRVNDTDFIHVDFNDGKRVVVWKRGAAGQDPVVVLANFSDFVTANASSPSAEYRVPNWPATPTGRQWREVTQQRTVPPSFVGREPIFPWEAKVYTLA